MGTRSQLPAVAWDYPPGFVLKIIITIVVVLPIVKVHLLRENVNISQVLPVPVWFSKHQNIIYYLQLLAVLFESVKVL